MPTKELKIYLFLIFLWICKDFTLAANIQQVPEKFASAKNIFGTRAFIENKGQFDRDLGGNTKIAALLDKGNEKVYFTGNGLVYKYTKKQKVTEEEREARERGKPFLKKPDRTYSITMTWPGANKNLSIELGEKQSYYLTYGAAEFNSFAYKKLTYKNVYDSIDIAYSLPENKEQSLKYSVIVHPGADPADLKLLYQGDVLKIKRTSSGQIRIKTPFGEIMEDAPICFYEDNHSVPSSFNLKDGSVSFLFPEGYDPKKTLIIDPFVTTVTSLSSSVWSNDYAFDVDYDNFGNAFIYGGSGTLRVAKYNATGVLQWAFSGIIISPAWSTVPNGDYAGNFLVDRSTGKTYVGQGINAAGNEVIRLDAAGNYDNFTSGSNTSFTEIWDMGFRCTSNDVVVFGGCVPSNISGVTINQITGAISMANFQPSILTGNQDIVSHAIDDAGTIFVNYASSISTSLNNKICAINSTFNGNTWTQPSTFTSLSEAGNKNGYVGYSGSGSNGFNSLAVNANYLFYYDGRNLAAYNKTTGSLLGSTTITTLTVLRQGGIAVDDCDNVYLGGNGSILSYHFSGSAFSVLTAISLNAGVNNNYVFDLKLDKNNKLLYVSGNSFVGTYSAINTVSCSITSTPCYVGIGLQNYAICSGASATISMPNTNGFTNATYSILPGATTNTNGNFVVTPSVTSSYTVFITGTNVFNVVQTASAVSTVSVFAQPALSPTFTQATCSNTLNAFNLGLSFSPSPATPNYTVNWTPSIPNGILSTSQTTLSGGINPGTFTATINAAGNCSATTVITINPVPPLPTYTLINLTGTTNLSCITPSVVLNVTSNYTTAPLNYLWTMNSFTSSAQTITVTSPATLITVQLSDVLNNCVTTGTYAVNGTISLSVTANNGGPYCKGSTANLSATSAALSYAWSGPNGFNSSSPNPSINNVNTSSSGVYTVLVSTGVCTAQATTTLSVANFTPAILSNNSPLCQGQKLVLNASGAHTYSWTGPNSFSSSIQNPTLVTTSINAQGIYSLANTAIGSYSVSTVNSGTLYCTTTLTTSVLITPVPTISTQNANACEGFSFQLSASGGTSYNWTGPGNFSSTFQNPLFNAAQTHMAGTYTVRAANGGSCSATGYASVSVNPVPAKPLILSTGPACLQTPISLSTPELSGLSYIWQGPNNFSISSPTVNLSGNTTLLNGIYTLTVKNAANCVNTSSVDVTFFALPSLGIFSSGNGCEVWCSTFSLQSAASNTLVNWILDGIKSESKDNKLYKCYNKAGTYSLSATIVDQHGCYNSATKTVEVYPKPVARFSYTPEMPVFTMDESVTFKDESTGNSIKQWDWYFIGKEQPHSSEQNPRYTYAAPGDYWVTLVVKDRFGCSDTSSKVLSVQDDFNLYVPDAFSPNEDGKNDTFLPKGTGIKKYELLIFNRWGTQIFSSNDFTKGWDGFYKNEACKNDIYIWKITLTTNSLQQKTYTGHVTLNR